jgi:aspartate aminotransferase-like enzyme
VDACAAQCGAELKILAPPGARSPTVSAIVLPDGVRGPDIVSAVSTRGITIGGGYGKLRDRTIRIGHMGDHTVEGVRRCLEVVGEVLSMKFGGVGDVRRASHPPRQ